MIYKIVHDLVDLDCNAFITMSNTATRNAYLKIFKPRVESSTRAKFFCVRSVNVWNSLSEIVRASPSVNVFKSYLSSCKLTDHLKVFKF